MPELEFAFWIFHLFATRVIELYNFYNRASYLFALK